MPKQALADRPTRNHRKAQAASVSICEPLLTMRELRHGFGKTDALRLCENIGRTLDRVASIYHLHRYNALHIRSIESVRIPCCNQSGSKRGRDIFLGGFESGFVCENDSQLSRSPSNAHDSLPLVLTGKNAPRMEILAGFLRPEIPAPLGLSLDERSTVFPILLGEPLELGKVPIPSGYVWDGREYG